MTRSVIPESSYKPRRQCLGNRTGMPYSKGFQKRETPLPMSRGLKRTLGSLLTVIVLYSLLGFFILPGVALRIANQQLANYATVPAKLERLEFNPYTLELTLWGLNIGTPGKEQVAFEKLYANLQINSLWTRALHLQRVELIKPRTELLFDKQGKLNLAQLFKLPASEPVKDEPPGKPFPLRIDEIKLADGYVHFQDLRPSQPIEFLYDTLNFELKNLSTLPEDNADMTLVAAGPDGGQIDWVGRISLIPITSEGTLKVTDSKMKLWWPYVRDALPLALEDGVLNFSTAYTLNLAKETELKLTNVSASVAPFALNTPDGRPLLRLQRLDVSETSVDLAKQLVNVGKIRSQKLETWAAREADGQLDWQKLFAGQPARPAAPQTPAVDEKAAEAPATAENAAKANAQPVAQNKPWQVLLRDVQLRNYMVHLADRVPQEPVALDVGPLNLDIQNFDSLNKAPFTLKLDTGLGKQGNLTAAGNVNLNPVSAQLNVTSRDIDLRIAQAYISPFIRLELRSGMLGSDLAVNLKSTEPLAFSVTGKAQVNQLHTLDTLKQRDFLKWQQLQLEGLDYQHGTGLSIAKVDMDQPYARFMINEDRTTNVDDLLIPQADDKTASQPKPARTQPKPKAENPLAIHVGEVNIKDGSANFADMTLTPNFATAVQQLNGRIGTIDNRKPTPAPVDIEGKVDRYAPVTIKGSLNPFDPMASLDITTSFKRVELTNLTPYSGKFAGFRIRKGRLNLDLHYLITKGQLKAQNKVLVEQLQLGERVDSPDALDLPIRLAVALLKDTQGRISLELPIEGDLNNPQFSVMPIVWQTLRNLVLRAAQAPFKMLGGLVAGGSSEDLGSVSFAPGSSDLSAEAQSALDKLSVALKERPDLKLEIEGTSAASSDGPLIAQQRLEREYQYTYYKILQRRGDKVPARAGLIQVPEDEKAPMLEGIYRTRLKQQPPAEWANLGKEQRAGQMRAAVLRFWSSNEVLLRELGQSRASSIKDYLVDKGKLEDARVYFVDARLGQAQPDGKVISPLHLDSE
ncbi:putative exported protein [Pseudomonas caricapapayae]|uniref:Putative exported protein n=2 Tax=Pseudomonas caricapapayae TaxID=46678 RepID=A0A3M6FH21_9PSED|nr:putative exported protein [Pseudomonas caricapapayae]